MIATYTQQTQTPSFTFTSSAVQTDTQTFSSNSTQKQIQSYQTTQATQTFPSLTARAVQTDYTTYYTPPIDSSTPTEARH